jgi:hypothetical protein
MTDMLWAGTPRLSAAVPFKHCKEAVHGQEEKSGEEKSSEKEKETSRQEIHAGTQEISCQEKGSPEKTSCQEKGGTQETRGQPRSRAGTGGPDAGDSARCMAFPDGQQQALAVNNACGQAASARIAVT